MTTYQARRTYNASGPLGSPTCIECESTFLAPKRTGRPPRYCSDECRQVAANARRRERVEPAPWPGEHDVSEREGERLEDSYCLDRPLRDLGTERHAPEVYAAWREACDYWSPGIDCGETRPGLGRVIGSLTEPARVEFGHARQDAQPAHGIANRVESAFGVQPGSDDLITSEAA